MSDEERATVPEIAGRMAEYARIDELSPEGYEDAMHAVAELTPIFTMTDRVSSSEATVRTRYGVYSS